MTDEEEVNLYESAKTDSPALGNRCDRYVERSYSYLYYRGANATDAAHMTARGFHRVLEPWPRHSHRWGPISA